MDRYRILTYDEYIVESKIANIFDDTKKLLTEFVKFSSANLDEFNNFVSFFISRIVSQIKLSIGLINVKDIIDAILSNRFVRNILNKKNIKYDYSNLNTYQIAHIVYNEKQLDADFINFLKKIYGLKDEIDIDSVNDDSDSRIFKKASVFILAFTLLVFLILVPDFRKDIERGIVNLETSTKKALHIRSEEDKKILTSIKTDSELERFLDDLAYEESRNDWTKIKQGHTTYIGLFQFKDISFKEIKSNITTASFLQNPKVWPEEQQKIDAVKLFKRIKLQLGSSIERIGDTVNGIPITLSGLIAGSMLTGATTVSRFLQSNGDSIAQDGNGIKVSTYIDKFKDYKIKHL